MKRAPFWLKANLEGPSISVRARCVLWKPQHKTDANDAVVLAEIA